MKIEYLTTYNLDEDYYDQYTINTLESHLTHLRSMSTLGTFHQTLTVKYAGDYYGLLSELGYHPNYHYVIMRINNMSSPTEYTGKENYLFVPPIEEIVKIVSTAATKKDY